MDENNEFISNIVADELARKAGFKSTREHLDAILMAEHGHMPLRSASAGALAYGFNHRQMPVAYDVNREHFGLTFFSRPDLALGGANCVRDRRMAMLMTKDRQNVQSFVRHTLDPDVTKEEGISCPLVDDLQPWIPLLTNTMISISGWPGLNASIGSTQPSRYGDVVNYYDGSIKELHREFNLSVNFQQMQGKFSLTLLFYWLYAAKLFQAGILMPKPIHFAECSKNYDLRIIRFVLDPFKRYIVDWTAAETAMIENIPIGEAYNSEVDTVFNTLQDEMTVSFRCTGYSPVDPRILKEFNDLTVKFNPRMADGLRNANYTKVDYEFLTIVNGEGYPWVNIDTKELEWYVTPERFKELLNRYQRIRNGAEKK